MLALGKRGFDGFSPQHGAHFVSFGGVVNMAVPLRSEPLLKWFCVSPVNASANTPNIMGAFLVRTTRATGHQPF
jgi:hypothetical protein